MLSQQLPPPAFDSHGKPHPCLQATGIATGTLPPHDEDDPWALVPVPVHVESTILDLYEEEWTPAILAVGNAVASRTQRHVEAPVTANIDPDPDPDPNTVTDAVTDAVADNGGGGVGINGFTGEINAGGSVSIAHCDIRSSLEGAGNEAFRELTPACDVFVFAFCIHENAEYLLGSSGGGSDADKGAGGDDGDDGLVGGCLPGLFQSAKVGAAMVMTDASHRLWPNMIHTAMRYGWRAEVVVVKMGPPSGSLVLERVGVGPLDYLTATGGTCEALLAKFQKHHEQHQRGLGKSVKSPAGVRPAREGKSKCRLVRVGAEAGAMETRRKSAFGLAVAVAAVAVVVGFVLVRRARA